MKSPSSPSTLVSLSESPSQPEQQQQQPQQQPQQQQQPPQQQQPQQQKPDTVAVVRPLPSRRPNGAADGSDSEGSRLSSSSSSKLLDIRTRATGWLIVMAAVMTIHQHIFLQSYVARTAVTAVVATATAGLRSRVIDQPQKDNVPSTQLAPVNVAATVVDKIGTFGNATGSSELPTLQNEGATAVHAVLDAAPNTTGSPSQNKNHNDPDATTLNVTTTNSTSPVVDNTASQALSES